VRRIASIVIEEMKLPKASVECTGGIDGGRGWKGDVKNMLLDISKIKNLGWKPELTSEEAVRKATRCLLTAASAD
jgi:UDP-glucose 4-epimerase